LVNQVNAEIVVTLAKAPEASSPGKPAGKGIRALFGRMRERLYRHREPGDRKPDGGRKTGPLTAHEHVENHNRIDVVLHPEAVLDPQVYGVNHRKEIASNGVAKGSGVSNHEGAAEAGAIVVKNLNPPAPHDQPETPEIKKN